MKNGGMIIVGVGGTGVLKASDVISGILLEDGYDVRQSEVHGMAQRGGSVITQIKYGNEVHSPLLARGEASFMLAMEELESLRYSSYLAKGARVVLNTWRLIPTGASPDILPESAAMILRTSGYQVYEIPARDIAFELNNLKVVNMVMVGGLSGIFLKEKETLWENILTHAIPTHLLDVNREAFHRGREWIRKYSEQ
ncbi:MAG: indolepyruvate oxidoreductase subunit beta [Candidatus Atribacteria bacterium]|nr:indolepyruvate oxidoreductase subunit beta [Candidatus Atribacteria bacterium]